jgi:FkbM family methyltransferase
MSGEEAPADAGAALPAAIYLLEIPGACSGQAVEHLAGLFSQRERCGPSLSWAALLGTPREQVKHWRLFVGHFGAGLQRWAPMPLRLVTFLRDPIQRAVAHHRHLLRHPEHHLHALVSELETFSRFIRDPRTQPLVVNFQLRCLGFEFDPLAGPAGEVEQRMELGAVDPIASVTAQARRAVEEAAFVGLAERPDESLGLMCEVLQIPPPEDRWASTAADPVDLSAADRALLEQLNAPEMELHAELAIRFERDWQRSKFVFPALHAFVSYAQNAEDVLLHRALGHVRNGHYIDVGANDPDGDSVTRAFYDRGWRGINVEPIAEQCARLRARRPEDVNLDEAAGASDYDSFIFEVPDTGLSTLDPAIAQRHAAMGFRIVKRPTIVRRLDDMLARHPIAPIHFLKIDVEGHEREVLLGIDLRRHRPWVVLAEATEPNTTRPSHQAWEPLLLENGYRFVHFDGINRYYLHTSREELASAFATSVNSTDGYMRAADAEAHRAVRRLRWQLEELAREHESATRHAEALDQWARSAEAHGRALQASAGVAGQEARSQAERAERAERYAADVAALLDRERQEGRERLQASANAAHEAGRHAEALAREVIEIEGKWARDRAAFEARIESAQRQAAAAADEAALRAAADAAERDALAGRAAAADAAANAATREAALERERWRQERSALEARAEQMALQVAAAAAEHERNLSEAVAQAKNWSERFAAAERTAAELEASCSRAQEAAVAERRAGQARLAEAEASMATLESRLQLLTAQASEERARSEQLVLERAQAHAAETAALSSRIHDLEARLQVCERRAALLISQWSAERQGWKADFEGAASEVRRLRRRLDRLSGSRLGRVAMRWVFRGPDSGASEGA